MMFPSAHSLWCRSRVSRDSAQPSSSASASVKSNSPVLSVLRRILPAGDQQRAVECEKIPMGQPALGIAFLWPGVAEIEVNPFETMAGSHSPKFCALPMRNRRLSGRVSAAVTADSSAVTMTSATRSTAIRLYFGSAAAVPTAKLPLPQPISRQSGRDSGKAACGFSRRYGRVGDQKMGTGSNSFCAMLPFSHSHLAIFSLI